MPIKKLLHKLKDSFKKPEEVTATVVGHEKKKERKSRALPLTKRHDEDIKMRSEKRKRDAEAVAAKKSGSEAWIKYMDKRIAEDDAERKKHRGK